MPTYRITAPDGRKLKLTGDNPPTKEKLDEIFSKLPVKSAFDDAKPIDEVKSGKEIVDNQNRISNQIFGSDITAGMKSQGPIGFFEAITREDSLTKFAPFLNLYDANKDRVINNNIQRYVNGEKLTDSEMVDVTNKVYKDVEASVRGYNWKGKVAYGLASSSSFMAEFALGGYLLKGLGLAAKGGQAINAGGKVAKAVRVGTALAKESALRTVVMPNRVLDSYNQRKINQMIAVTDKGQVLLKDIKEKPSLTLLKSFGDVFVENYTEKLGDALLSPIFNKTGKIFKRAIPKKLLDGIEKITPEVTNMPFNKAIKSMGWDGLLEEIGEERLGDLMRSSLGLSDEEYNFENIAKSIIPDYEDFMVEAGVISITGGTMRGAQILSNKLISNGVGSNKAKGIVSNMTPLEIDETLKNPAVSVEAKEIEQSYIQERDLLIDKMINAGINESDARDVQKSVDQRVLALGEAINVPASDIVKNWGLDIVKSTNEQEENERAKTIYTLVREEGFTPEEARIEVEKDVLKQEDVKKGYIRLYRGLEQKFSKDYDMPSTDAPVGYSTWTDNKELARQYAGENGFVYQIDLPLKEQGDELINEDGDRVLFLDNEKKAGLNDISGKEYLLYTEHENYMPDDIKLSDDVDILKQDSRGQIEFAPDKTTIKLLEKADKSTILHELGHLFLKDIISYNEVMPENKRLKNEIQSVRKFVGNTGETFTREQEESFARGFEAYLREGKAPVPEIQNAFDKFKVWLQSIYNSMIELNVKMNKKSIDMFEDLFLTQKQLTEKRENKKKLFVENISNIQLSLEKIEGNEIGEVKKIIDKMLKSDIDIDIDINEAEKIKINLLSAIRQYRKTLKMKKGRQGQTVAEFLRNNKSFKISRKFVEHGLQRKGEFEALKIPTYVNKPTMGEIWVTQEDTLMQILKDEGFITESTELSDTDVLDDLLYNAEITRKVTDESLTRELYDASVDMADRGLSEISTQLELGITAEQFLDIINTLKKKGFNVVETQDLNKIYKEFKQSKNKQKDIEKQNIDNLANAKSKLNSYFTNMNLSFKDKADLFKKVSAIKDINQYNEKISKILNYANELLEDNLKDRQIKFIKNILKSYSVKTDKQGIKRSKLDVGTQKILNDLIEINSLDINQAKNIYLNIGKDEIYSDYELLKNKMITYRFKGFDSPASLLQSLSNDLNKLVEYGKTAKTEKDALNRLNRINEVIDFNQGINHIKADVDTVKTKIANTYRAWFTNIYSALNSVAGKKIADEYGNKLEFGFSKMFTDNYKHDKRANKEIAKILDVKENQIADTLIDCGKEDYKLVSKKGVTYKLNKMMIIDIYNAIKQNDIKNDYFENYNKDDILALIGNLTDKDKALGDYLAKEVQSYYDIMNDAVVDIYGTALPKVKNYWSSSVENVKDVNLVSQFDLTSQLPSALESRMGSRVPVPSNAWNKYTSYVTQANYMKNVGREFRDISLLLKDSSVTRNIINKFGNTVRNNISNLMEGMSLNGIKNIESSLSGIVNTVLNNWVTAKIGLNPSVFVKQLGSVTNYAENMPVKEWGKLFLEGLSKPKETIRFMFDNVEYLQARFSKGYSEEISRAIATASKLSTKKQSLTNVMTSLTRLGDIGAIIFGGYPKLKYELNQGKSMQEAVDSFVLETIKSQQSGLQSSLSVAQQSKNGFMRMLFAFKNTPAQYMRKIADTILQYQNGDISKEQMQKSLVNYLVVQPAIYSWIGSLMVGRFFDDEEFSSFKDLMATLLSQPFSAIPFLDDISKWVSGEIVGNKQWKVFNNSFLSDIENTLRKTKKKDITIEDLVDIVGTGAELGVGIPVKTVNRWIKRMTGENE